MSDDSKSIVKGGVDKATADLTLRLEQLGFKRTKKMYWVRLKESSAEFIHLHTSGSSYGSPINNSVSFRLHCGNRMLNDDFESLALNGPDSDSPESIERKYHLRFNAKSGSTYERCINDLEKFITEIGEPWFTSVKDKTIKDKEIIPSNIKHSYKLLGVKGVKV